MSSTTVSLDTNLIVSVLNQELEFCDRAQAVVRGYTLLTLDGRLYRASFPRIRIESF